MTKQSEMDEQRHIIESQFNNEYEFKAYMEALRRIQQGVDGPAIECADGSKYWYQEGNLHRLNGPAIEYTNGDKERWEIFSYRVYTRQSRHKYLTDQDKTDQVGIDIAKTTFRQIY